MTTIKVLLDAIEVLGKASFKLLLLIASTTIIINYIDINNLSERILYLILSIAALIYICRECISFEEVKKK